MLTLFIILLLGSVSGWFVAADHDTVAGVITGIFTALVFQIIAGLIMRYLVNKKQMEIQNILIDAQNRIQKQINLFQHRPPSSQNAARQTLEKIQNDAARKALAATDCFKPYYIWSILLKKQINTMKMQLLFQLGEYKKVDAIMPSCFIVDHQSLAIKLVRMYRNNDAKLDSFFLKRCSRTKGEARAFLCSVYAWMKIKQEQPEKALEALNLAKKVSDHHSIAENIDHIANGRYRHFTNSGFGDAWYALGLEEPKVKPQKQMRNRMF